MIEGLIGTLGVLAGSTITYYFQQRMQIQDQEYKEKSIIRELKLKKYESVLEDIKNQIRSYGAVYLAISKILELYESKNITQEELKTFRHKIEKEGDHHCNNLYRYGFLFNIDNINNIVDSDLSVEYIQLYMDIIPRINIENINNGDFRWNMKVLSIKAKTLSEQYLELSNEVKCNIREGLIK